MELRNAVRYTHPVHGDVIDTYETMNGLQVGASHCLFNGFADIRLITASVVVDGKGEEVALEVGCGGCGRSVPGIRTSLAGFICPACHLKLQPEPDWPEDSPGSRG